MITDKNGKKRFVKGRVLKQHINHHRGGYLYLSFHVNGKTIHRYVHQIVAITFIPNPHGYSQVNHKDNDPTNNTESNLEWCTIQYNNDYKKKCGTSPAEVQGRLVFAVDLRTGKVLRFQSQHEASRQLGISQQTIWAIINGQTNTAGGYWFTENESEITEEKIHEIKAKMRFHGPVVAVNLSDSKVLCFKSQSEAAHQLNISIQGICAVIHGRLNKTGGYWFCKADKNAVEKVRARFGDEVARKVGELMSDNL